MSGFKPSQYSVYKSKTTLRLSLGKPQRDYETGYVFAEVAPAKGKNAENNTIYDWDKKISIKLGVVDLSKMAYALQYGQSCDLVHQYDGGTKTIRLQRTDSGSPYFFTVLYKKGEAEDKISVPISSDEAYVLLTLFQKAITEIHGW